MSRPPLGSTLDIFGLSINWYSLLMMAAVAIGIWLAMREERRLDLPKDIILNMALLAIPLGIIGARLYYVAFTWNRYANDLLEILRVWNGGLAIYGAVIGGLIAALIVTRGKRHTFLSLLDACAPSLVLGQAIGRWGNYANMEAYGARIYTEAFQFFPIAVEVRLLGANGTEFWYWHMATFFYEFVWNVLVFALLMAYRKKMKRPGDVVCWYALLYCAGRTVIEGLRDDSLLLNVATAQVRVSQIVSALVCVAVAVVFFVRLTKSRKLHLADYLSWALIALGVACTFVGEFERNAYMMLFNVAQAMVLALALVDLVFFVHFVKRARAVTGVAALLLAGFLLSVLTLVLGIGRLGVDNIAYIALRQSVAMLHVIVGGVWFYLRAGAPKRRRTRRVAESTPVTDAEVAPEAPADGVPEAPQPFPGGLEGA